MLSARGESNDAPQKLDHQSVGTNGSSFHDFVKKTSFGTKPTELMDDNISRVTDPSRPGRESPTQLKSLLSSTRRERLMLDGKMDGLPKSRSFVSSDEIKWNLDPTTFDEFADDMEGTLRRLGMGHMLDPVVQDAHQANGN